MGSAAKQASRQQGARTRPERPMDAETLSEDRQFVTAIARGFDVLRAFTAQDTMLGNQELAERTGLPKPTVSRVTYTLTRLGYLFYLPQFAKYQLGLGVLVLGQAAAASASVWRSARPLMQELARETNASVALGCRDGLEVLYVENCPPAGPVALRLGVGSRIPLATTAAGRAIIAALPAPEREQVLRELEGHSGDDWPRIRAGLEEALRMHASLGFVASLGDWRSEVYAVGVPLVLPNGAGVLGMNCGTSAYGLDRAWAMQQAGPRLVELARRLTALTQSTG